MLTDEQKYAAVLKELGDTLAQKNTQLCCQKWQIDNLKGKLAAAEQERDDTLRDYVEADLHLMAASEAFAQLRTINIALRKCLDLKNGIILDAAGIIELQSDIQEALRLAEGE